MKLVRLEPGSMVYDRDAVITPEMADAVIAAGGVGICRCILHPTMPNQDLSRAELEMLHGKGLVVRLYVYFRDSGYTTETGKSDADRAVAKAQEVGWPTTIGAPIEWDLEGDVMGPDVPGYCAAACASTSAVFSPEAYDFWDAEKSTKDAAPFRAWWKSAGLTPHAPSRGYQMVQGQTLRIGGFAFDPNTVQKDARGELPLFVAADDWQPKPKPEPAPTPAPAPADIYPDPAAGKMWKLVTAASDAEIRAFIVGIWKPWAGLSDAPATRGAFRDVVAPVWLEGPTLSAEMAGSWCCGESDLGCTRALFKYGSPELKSKLHAFRRYEIGMAIVWVQLDAESLGADRTHADQDLAKGVHPEMGDSMLIDGGFHDCGCFAGPVAVGNPIPTVEGGDQIVVGGKPYMAISAGTRRLRADGAWVSKDGKTVHTEFKWVDRVAMVRAAAKIDPELRILVDLPPPLPAPPSPPPAPPSPPPVLHPTPPAESISNAAKFLHALLAGAGGAGLALAHFLRDHPVADVAILVAAAALVVVLWRARRAQTR